MDDPEFYDSNNFLQKRDAQMVLDKFSSAMLTSEGDRILDIGCGTGNITFELLSSRYPRSQHIVGIDKCDKMVNFAKKTYKKEGIHFETLDITDESELGDFRCKWKNFTKIFSFYCLHWITDHRIVLSNMKLLMDEVSQCLLMFVAQCPVFAMYEIMAQVPKWTEYMTDVADFIPAAHHSSNPVRDFSALMQGVGLTIMDCMIMEESFTFESVDALQDCMRAVNPFICRIPESQRDQYIQESLITLARLKANDVNHEKNQLKFTYKLLVALACKTPKEK